MFKKDYSSVTSSYVADIMSGLMIIFLFISVSYMIEVGEEKVKSVFVRHWRNIFKKQLDGVH